MTRSAFLQTIAIVIALAAAFVSFNLLAKHLSGTTGTTWFEAGCSPQSEGSRVSCAAVLASPYAYLPFKREGEPQGTPHVPVAFAGMVYYSVIAVWLIGVGRPSFARRWLHLLPLGMVTCGLVGSAFFTYIMFSKVDQWCPWCMVTHVLNVFLAVLLVIMWPRRRAECDGDQASGSPTQEPSPEALNTTPESSVALRTTSSETPNPSTRQLVATVMCVVLIAFGQREMLGQAQARIEGMAAKNSFNACVGAITRIKADTDRFVRYWQFAELQEIPVRPDDPMRIGPHEPGTDTPDTPSEHRFQVVVFSDFECPSCKRLAVFLHDEVEPLLGGSLTTVFKHYPLNSDCNPRTTSRMHPHACEAARMAEAARTVGGNDAFWRAHDYLFDNQANLKRGRLQIAAVAETLGLDYETFSAAMLSDDTTARIAEDADLARRCGVTHTPAVFINGRMADGLGVREVGFWEKVAESYRPGGDGR